LALSGLPAFFTVATLILFPMAMSLRWRSVHNGLYSVAAWNLFALSFLPGFMRSRVSPIRWIESSIIKDGPIPINSKDMMGQREWPPVEVSPQPACSRREAHAPHGVGADLNSP
jgi:hypothetical protein